MTHCQIAMQNGIKAVTYYQRVRRGWTKARAATTPARQYFREWVNAAR